MASTPKFYTYKADAQSKLGPNETLAFQIGKGYFAKPKPVAKAADPLAPFTETQIDASAQKQTSAQIAPQAQAILDAQARARVAQKQDTDAITGFYTAAADIMKGLGPQYQAVFSRGAQELGGLAGNFSDADAARTAAAQEANRIFEMQHGGVTTGGAVDPKSLHDVEYALSGSIPGEQLTREGVSAATWGLAQPGIETARGRDALLQRIAQGMQDGQKFLDQMSELEAKRPDIYNQIVTELHNQEISKANARTQQQAQELYQRQFGETVRSHAAQETVDQQNANTRQGELNLSRQKERNAVKKAEAAGRQVDASASKVLGHIVDKQGRPILDNNGKQIPVNDTGSGGSAKSRDNRAKAITAASGDAYSTAVDLLGKPQKNPSVSVLAPGLYIAKPGAGGKDVYRGKANMPKTTNNPAKAQSDSQLNFRQAFNQVWASIAGDQLAAQYGISPAQLRKMIRQQMIRAGWKPDGKRP